MLGNVVVKGKKNMKVVTDTHRYWNEVPMPTLNFEKFSKYLGVFIKYDGEVALPITEWKTTGKVEKMSSKPITKGRSDKTSSICKNVVSDKTL